MIKAARPDLAEALFEAVETHADEVAIVSLDGRPTHLPGPGQARIYWKIATSVDVDRVDVTEFGVKDVILPGEIRELVNKVVEAERTAKANLIRRQEETAATRSLLNTAKLMEENPLLLRLKELESLERLVEKVGRIDLHAGEGQGLDALLTRLVRLKAREPA